VHVELHGFHTRAPPVFFTFTLTRASPPDESPLAQRADCCIQNCIAQPITKRVQRRAGIST